MLWAVLSSQTRDENNPSPHPPKMRFLKEVTNPHLLEEDGFLNAVLVAYTCTFPFRKTTKIPKETFLSVSSETQNPRNEGMEETFFPASLSPYCREKMKLQDGKCKVDS